MPNCPNHVKHSSLVVFMNRFPALENPRLVHFSLFLFLATLRMKRSTAAKKLYFQLKEAFLAQILPVVLYH